MPGSRPPTCAASIRPSRARTDGPFSWRWTSFLEARGGKTVVRLVHSGFGGSAEWDEQIEGLESGWTYFLRQLKHYLERHRGERRDMVWARPKTENEGPAIWGKLFSEKGLGSVDLRRLSRGSRLPLGFGGKKDLEAEMDIANVPRTFSAVRVDSSNTHTLCFRGSADASGSVLTYSGEIGDPASGQLKSARVVLRILSPDRHSFEMSEVLASGEERKFFDIIYTRQTG
jgi:hypothetical protein